ncbi:hypothetical protein L2E82_30138 [Cichorium intybus]|uniref:Uncharacterized protein n=1 Tax=Cichorium intybus TaxID=13427 RepID=A0ACB9CZJ8_CICIN|nr:hypothetical protein L2E82_30138 [Cichorium intybus]
MAVELGIPQTNHDTEMEKPVVSPPTLSIGDFCATAGGRVGFIPFDRLQRFSILKDILFFILLSPAPARERYYVENLFRRED